MVIPSTDGGGGQTAANDFTAQQRPVAVGSLSAKTTTGLAGLLLNTVVQKGLGFASQMMLAWFLTPEDFGLVGMAYTFSAFATVLSAGSVKDVLVQRQEELDDLVNPAFWLSVVMGLGSVCIMAICAPLSARWYDNRTVAGLVLIMAAIAIPTAINVVPNALLEIHMRFKAVTALSLLASILLPLMTVGMAWAGGGAYSLVVPRLLLMVLVAGLAWKISGMRIKVAPEFRKWRSLIGSTTLVVLFGFVCSLIPQMDRIALGRFHGEKVLGLYFFAFGLSSQIGSMLSVNLVTVLFPAISKLRDEPQRQVGAVLRASRCIALVGIPLCLLQAAVARPSLYAIFPARWNDAAPILTVLSFSLACLLVVLPSHSLLRATGKFGTLLWIAAVQLVVMGAASFLAAWLGGPVAVAVANAIVSLVFGVWFVLASLRPFGLGWHTMIGAYGRSVLIGLVVFAVAMGICWPHFASRLANLLQLCVAGGIGVCLHLFLARQWMPGDWADLKARVGQLVNRGRTV